MKYLNEIGSKTEGYLVLNNRPSKFHSITSATHALPENTNLASNNENIAQSTTVPKGLLLRLSLSENNVRRFNHCSWSKNSNQLLCSDHIGSVYLLDLSTSRWQLVNSLNSASTALCFNLKRNSTEYLVASSDTPLIRCYSTDNRNLVGTLRGHKFPAFSINVRQKPGNHSGHHSQFYDDYVLTLSPDSCFLWDLRDFSQKRKLSVQNESVRFQSGLFCGPDFSSLLTIFKDQSIFVWDAKNMTKKYKISPMKEHIGSVKAICISPNGEEVALAGGAPDYSKSMNEIERARQMAGMDAVDPILKQKSHLRRIAIFNLLTGELEQVLELEKLNSDITQLFYLSKRFDTKTYSPTLGLVSKDGHTTFINTNTGHEVGKMGDSKFGFYKAFFPCFDGTKIACVSKESKIDIYKTEFALPKILGLAASPLVKTVGKLWKKKTIASRSIGLGNNDNLLDNFQNREDDNIVEQQMFHTGGDQKRFQSCPFIKSRQTASQSRSAMANPPVKGGVVDISSALEPNYSLKDTLGAAKLSYKKLGRILQGYNSYPDRYRKFIWQTLLELPMNEAAFTSLVARGSHPAWKNIGDKFQIKSPRLSKILEKILSALAYYSEIFCELEYLPMIIFPFVKIFQYNHLICFETVLTFLRNFCLHWYEFFPNPPIGVLAVIENVIAENDKSIYHHLVHYKITSQTYAWPVLQTAFSEILTKDELLVFLDHLFYKRNPLYLLCAVAAYIIICRDPISRITNFEDFEYFFRHRNAINVNLLIKKTDFLYQKTIENQSNLRFSRHYMQTFQPLTKGSYQIFNSYPEFVVDYRKKETERIRKEQKRQLSNNNDNKTKNVLHDINRVRKEAEAWLREQKAMDDAINERRKYINSVNSRCGIDQKVQSEPVNSFHAMPDMSPQKEYVPKSVSKIHLGKVYNNYSKG